jgi:low affinity Fe/Cu permease
MTQQTVHQNNHSQPNGSPTVAVLFPRLAQATALWSGHPAAFLLALTVIAVWIITGPIFNYSDTWQLVINTGTTIVTFLMVFLIQNTQNRDMMTVQLKLSELVLAMKGAPNKFAVIEDLTDKELQALHDENRARRINAASSQLPPQSKPCAADSSAAHQIPAPDIAARRQFMTGGGWNYCSRTQL